MIGSAGRNTKMSTALLLVQLVQRLEASLTPLLRRAGPALLVFTWALLLGVPLLFFDLLLRKARGLGGAAQ